MVTNVAGLDIGTSSIKLLWADELGKTQIRSMAHSGLLNNNYEIDSCRIMYDIKELFKKSQINANSIQAIGLSTFFPSFIAVNCDGAPLTNVLTWLDSNGQEELRQYQDSVDDPGEYHHRTGCVLHSAHTIWKILWLKTNYPSIYSKAHKLLTLAEYVIFQLTGEYATSISHASTTGYFNIEEMRWDPELLSYMSIPESSLPDYYPVTQRIPLKKNVAVELGFSWIPDLVLGGGDGILANIGSGCLSSKQICSSLGTSGAIRVTSEKPNSSSKVWNYRFDTKYYVSGYAINAGYATFKSIGQLLNRSDILKDICSMDENRFNEVLFLPFLHGERGPEYHPHQSGVFWGLTSQHTTQDLIKAVAEGIFFNLYDCYLRMTGEETPNELIAAGGYVSQTKLVQLQADIFNRKILIPAIKEASAFGACLVACDAVYSNFRIQDYNFQFSRICYPNLKKYARYNKKYRAFQRLYMIRATV